MTVTNATTMALLVAVSLYNVVEVHYGGRPSRSRQYRSRLCPERGDSGADMPHPDGYQRQEGRLSSITEKAQADRAPPRTGIPTVINGAQT